MASVTSHRNLKATVVLVLGLLAPLFLLFQAYHGMSTLQLGLGDGTSEKELVQTLSDVKKTMPDDRDYALFSLLFSEHMNQRVMGHKQVLKAVVMQIGFAVASVGLMFIVLGVSDGGASATGEATGIKVDFKTGSTGLLVFVVGSAMAAAGGLMKNDYGTVTIPFYSGGQSPSKTEKSVEAYHACKGAGLQNEAFHACFVDLFEQVNAEVLK